MGRWMMAMAGVAFGAFVGTTATADPVSGLTRVGQCAATRVKWVGQRLESNGKPVPGSGSSITLANGVYGVAYDQVAAVNASRVGDPVRVCLASIPTGCPKGDMRGRMYKSTNLRTRQSWTLPDAEHQCGGA